MAEIRKAPNSIGKARVDIVASDFDLIVYQKGFDVLWERAMPCPCELDGRGNIPTCVNCGGMGFIFVEPIETRMVLQSLNMTSKFKEWAFERVGTASVIARSADVLSEMDRITMTGAMAKASQLVRALVFDGGLFSFLNYPAITVDAVYKFGGAKIKLELMDESTYEVDGNKIHFSVDKVNEGDTFTIRYSYHPQFQVVDVTRELRESKVVGMGFKEKDALLPISAVVRRSHYVLRGDDYWNPIG